MKHLTAKLLLLYLLVALILCPPISHAQGLQIVTISDISGDGAAHAIASSGTARWIQFVASPTNSTASCGTGGVSGCPRVGDSSISTTRGTPLQPGVGFPLLESSGAQRWQLSQVYYLVQSGDKLTIMYAQ